MNYRLALSGQRATSRPTHEVSRLLMAAVISDTFRHQLLHDPAQALEEGYNGMHFALTLQEREQLLAITASSLTDLASQMVVKRMGSMPKSPTRYSLSAMM